MSLSPQKQKCIVALLTNKSKAAAASAVGISTRTLQRYFEDPVFLQAYRNAFTDLIDSATRRGQQIISPAFDTLEEIMRDTEITPAARVSAARAALEYTLRLTEANDIIEKLERLEEKFTE